MTTDIVVCTHNRLALLKRTLEYLFERTLSPYRLFVIDDASTEGNADYLRSLQARGLIADLVLRSKSEPIGENWNSAARLAESDILVFSDDDILCPKLNPDWLTRGLSAMMAYPKLGLLALENPSSIVFHAIEPIRQEGPLTLCDRVGGYLAFVRRDLMRSIAIPPVGGVLEGMTVYEDSRGLDRAWSKAVWARGYWVAYLTGIYCQHIGTLSARNGHDLSARLIEPINADTLEPPRVVRKWS